MFILKLPEMSYYPEMKLYEMIYGCDAFQNQAFNNDQVSAFCHYIYVTLIRGKFIQIFA